MSDGTAQRRFGYLPSASAPPWSMRTSPACWIAFSVPRAVVDLSTRKRSGARRLGYSAERTRVRSTGLFSICVRSYAARAIRHVIDAPSLGTASLRVTGSNLAESFSGVRRGDSLDDVLNRLTSACA